MPEWMLWPTLVLILGGYFLYFLYAVYVGFFRRDADA